MKAILIKTTRPDYNLAVEEALFEQLSQNDSGYFLLWQNAPSIIVGRHQNTVEEVNETYVKEHNLPVVRRETGGGAVYHDLGNVNFSFISSLVKNEDTSFAKYIDPIATALKEIGFAVEVSGRNDMLIDGRKFSGNAKRQTHSKILQHGTIMINLDTSHLSDILTGNPDKFTSKGIRSHKSRVANLMEYLPHYLQIEWSDYSKADQAKRLIKRIQETLIHHCATTSIDLPQNIHERAIELATKKYSMWEWNFGQSPKFSTKWRKRFTWGALDFYADIKNGCITACSFYGDFFVNKDIAELENTLTGLPYKRKNIKECLQKIHVASFFVGAQEEELLNFFEENIL